MSFSVNIVPKLNLILGTNYLKIKLIIFTPLVFILELIPYLISLSLKKSIKVGLKNRISISCSLIAVVLLMVPREVCAQENKESRLFQQRLILISDTLISQNSTIIPESISISSSRSIEYQYLIDNNTLSIGYTGKPDTLVVSYRTLTYDLVQSTPILSEDDIQKKSKLIRIAGDYTVEEKEQRRLIESTKIEYSGSFTRGMNAGNNQDLVLESDFNLQMKGDLGSGLKVRAAISDDNIPIQPQGNTQILQEFDKVYIELSKDRTSLIAGDYELARPESYFINYYKKLKGVSARNESSFKNNWIITNEGSFAISRGKFIRLELPISEGNQGPYKLEGEANQLFLQVLSGTEKIYADGRLLKRGENYDYVIDYNRAELRFTPNYVITANTRIIAEYEYATQEYLRSLYATKTKISNDKWNFNINFYNEQDSKTTTGNILLDSLDLATLREIGDNPAFRSGIFIPENNNYESLIKYNLEDDNILNFAPDAPDDSPSLRAANFSNLTNDLASYEIDNEAGTNGRVYKYVGEGLGSFGPWLPLIAPEKKQILSVGSGYEFNEASLLYFESAISTYDRNRFSEVDAEDDTGLSFHGKFTDSRNLFKKKQAGKTDSLNENLSWTLESSASIELTDADFQALNPYRDTEFLRDWNLSGQEPRNSENLFNVRVDLKNNFQGVGYSLSGYNNQGTYSGLKNIATAFYKNKGWNTEATYNILNSETNLQKTTFLRPKALISKELYRKITVGSYYEKEQNITRSLNSDSLSQASFDYDLYQFFVKSDDTKDFHIDLSYTFRVDDAVTSDQLLQSSTASDYRLGGAWRAGTTSDLTWQLTFRDFNAVTGNPRGESSKKTFLGTINHKFSALKKGVLLDSYFESNSGQEPKLEFQYIKVQRGEGSYIWNDWNLDSLQQINEFEIAPLSDQADYEKITVFNNEFISTNKSALNFSLRLFPKRFLNDKKHLLGRFQTTTRFRIDQRILSQDDLGLIRGISSDLLDTNLVSSASLIDANIFFDRGKVERDFQVSYRKNANKIQQITGYELRNNQEFFTKTRINLKKRLDFILETKLGTKIADSEMFEIQRFTIDYWNLIPKLNFRPSQQLRIIISYDEQRQKNKIAAQEEAKTRKLSFESTWRKSQKSNLQMGMELVYNVYAGQRNSPVELEMLQGLKPGTNYLWNVNYLRRISSSFDLIFNYQGRKSEATKIVNTAGVQLRAIF